MSHNVWATIALIVDYEGLEMVSPEGIEPATLELEIRHGRTHGDAGFRKQRKSSGLGAEGCEPEMHRKAPNVRTNCHR